MYQFNVPTFGKGVVFDVDSKVRAEQFRFFASALQTGKLKSYVPLFVKETEVRLCSQHLITLRGFGLKQPGERVVTTAVNRLPFAASPQQTG